MRDILGLQFRLTLKTKYLCKVRLERLLFKYLLFHILANPFDLKNIHNLKKKKT